MPGRVKRSESADFDTMFLSWVRGVSGWDPSTGSGTQFLGPFVSLRGS